MGLKDKIWMFLAYRLAKDSERKYIDMEREVRQAESEMMFSEVADPQSGIARECAAAIIAICV